jgi:hypothetical protein
MKLKKVQEITVISEWTRGLTWMTMNYMNDHEWHKWHDDQLQNWHTMSDEGTGGAPNCYLRFFVAE